MQRLPRDWKVKSIFWRNGFSGYWRGKFHLKGLEKEKPDSVLWEHNLKFHPERKLEPSDFCMKVTGCYPRPLLRLCQEGLAIGAAIQRKERGEGVVEVMNSKKEFLQPGSIRPNVVKRL